jgi:hypothetical protein
MELITAAFAQLFHWGRVYQERRVRENNNFMTCCLFPPLLPRNEAALLKSFLSVWVVATGPRYGNARGGREDLKRNRGYDLRIPFDGSADGTIVLGVIHKLSQNEKAM